MLWWFCVVWWGRRDGDGAEGGFGAASGLGGLFMSGLFFGLLSVWLGTGLKACAFAE